MKKSIFGLSYEEGIKLDKELKKTSYFRQYYLINIVSVSFIVLILIAILFSKDLNDSTINICFLIAIGFVSIIYLIFNFKRFDLIKLYYDENRKEK